MVFNTTLTLFQLHRYSWWSVLLVKEMKKTTDRGIARIMEKYRHNLFQRGSGAAQGGPWCKAHGLYNRKRDVFDNFGSAFNNMKFRLFCPFLTISLRTN